MKHVLSGIALLSLCAGSPAAAETAPDFTLYDTYSQPVSIKGYRGSIVWLTFGSTW